MSSGPVEVYNGTSGVANTGGDSLTEDLNIYYSVCKTIRISWAYPADIDTFS